MVGKRLVSEVSYEEYGFEVLLCEGKSYVEFVREGGESLKFVVNSGEVHLYRVQGGGLPLDELACVEKDEWGEMGRKARREDMAATVEDLMGEHGE